MSASMEPGPAGPSRPPGSAKPSGRPGPSGSAKPSGRPGPSRPTGSSRPARPPRPAQSSGPTRPSAPAGPSRPAGPSAAPASAAQALALIHAGLDYLTACDPPSLPTAVQAEALISLERACARQIAARTQMLTAFSAGHGYEADGQYGAGAWLRA